MGEGKRAQRTTMPAPDGQQVATIFGRGEMVGDNYEIRQLLGRGGMGQVFEAHDHALDRRVAIKTAWPRPHAPPLRNEARALAAFRHPSLPTVHTLGQHRGTDFIVMERIYGLSLEHEIARRASEGPPFSVRDTLDILVAIAEGLSIVHAAGIAHRDVKPGNIMLSADGRVVLMDFGLMLPEFEVGAQQTVAGSPPYMAPEALLNVMAKGEGHLVDLYALGVLAYEMLVGKRPRPEGSIEELARHQARATIAPISDTRGDVPARLAALVEEMLSVAASERPQSAEAVVWSLKSIRDRDVVAAREGPTRVIVVDDDRDIARVLGFYAKKALGEIELRTLHDGEAALQALREQPADVMLLDLHMPHVNGLEVCMYIRGSRLADDMTIVPVTAGAEDHDRQLLHSLGIRHFVQKGERLQQDLSEVLHQLAGR